MKTKLCKPVLIKIEDQDHYPILGINAFDKKKELVLIKGNTENSFNYNYYQIVLTSLKDDKIIATQDQLPLEYIQQFIEEYNKGEVKEVKIEWEQYGRFNTIRHPYVTSRPKLTNDFVSIIKKEL